MHILVMTILLNETMHNLDMLILGPWEKSLSLDISEDLNTMYNHNISTLGL